MFGVRSGKDYRGIARSISAVFQFIAPSGFSIGVVTWRSGSTNDSCRTFARNQTTIIPTHTPTTKTQSARPRRHHTRSCVQCDINDAFRLVAGCIRCWHPAEIIITRGREEAGGGGGKKGGKRREQDADKRTAIRATLPFAILHSPPQSRHATNPEPKQN